MANILIDTNVPIVANYKHQSASEKCVLACIKTLEEVVEGKNKLLVDDHYFIWGEYEKNLSRSGRPGVGDRFFKFLCLHQYNPEICRIISVTPRNNDGTDFEEFPTDPDLEGFDSDDRKFVAVALADGGRPSIKNATDTDWSDYLIPLNRNGISIDFLCPELMNNENLNS